MNWTQRFEFPQAFCARFLMSILSIKSKLTQPSSLPKFLGQRASDCGLSRGTDVEVAAELLATEPLVAVFSFFFDRMIPNGSYEAFKYDITQFANGLKFVIEHDTRTRLKVSKKERTPWQIRLLRRSGQPSGERRRPAEWTSQLFTDTIKDIQMIHVLYRCFQNIGSISGHEQLYF